jgi:hypothetical protein
MEEEETNQETSSYPENEELEMEKCQAIIWLFQEMIDPKSWTTKHFKEK